MPKVHHLPGRREPPVRLLAISWFFTLEPPLLGKWRKAAQQSGANTRTAQNADKHAKRRKIEQGQQSGGDRREASIRYRREVDFAHMFRFPFVLKLINHCCTLFHCKHKQNEGISVVLHQKSRRSTGTPNWQTIEIGPRCSTCSRTREPNLKRLCGDVLVVAISLTPFTATNQQAACLCSSVVWAKMQTPMKKCHDTVYGHRQHAREEHVNMLLKRTNFKIESGPIYDDVYNILHTRGFHRVAPHRLMLP